MRLKTMWWLNQLRNENPDGGDPGGGTPPAGGDGGTPPAPGGDGGGGDGGDPPPSWLSTMPETWRSEVAEKAGFDEKTAKMLDRVPDPASLAKSWVDAQAKIRQGLASNALPDDASEEQIKEWREANNVPLEASGYKLDMGDTVLSDGDERILGEVSAIAHKHNIKADAYQEMTTAWMNAREAEIAKQEELDNLQAVETQRALADVWGKENIERNRNAIKGLLNSKLPEPMRELLLNSRAGDGRALFNHPEIMQFFADLAFDINPAGAVLPNDGAGLNGVKDRIAEIEKYMADDPDAYFKDQKVQEELRQLYEVQEKIEAQESAA